MAEEKRRYPRVRADFGVQYRIKGSDSALTKAVSSNISEGGIMMKIMKRLDTGTLLELRITLLSPRVTFNTLARAVYILDNYWDEHPPYRCGVKFLKLTKKNKETIKKFVKKEIAKLDWDRWL